MRIQNQKTNTVFHATEILKAARRCAGHARGLVHENERYAQLIYPINFKMLSFQSDSPSLRGRVAAVAIYPYSISQSFRNKLSLGGLPLQSPSRV